MIAYPSSPILIVTPSLFVSGGRERVLSNFSKYLHDKIDIMFLTLDGQRDSYFEMPNDVKIETLKTFYQTQQLDGKKLHHNLQYFTDVKKVRNFLKNNKDRKVVISTDVYCSIILYFASLGLKSRKFIANEHMIFDVKYNPLLIRIRNFIYPRLFDKVITLTHKDQSKYKSIGCNNVDVIPNALTFQPAQPKIQSNYKILLAVGRYSYEKGFDLLIKACKPVFDKHKDWKLKLIGSGHLKNELELLIKELQLEDNIFLSPTTLNIQQEYIEADIYILSSRNEAFPMVLTEAMSFGMACISFDCPSGPGEIMTHNKDGLLVTAEDINKLSETINLLIENPEKREELGQAAFLSMQRLYPQNVFEKWLKEIKELI